MPRRTVPMLILLTAVLTVATAYAQSVDDPSRAPGRARRALAATQKYRDAGDHERAVAVLTETLIDHPENDHHLLRLHLALSLRHLGRDAEALEHLNLAAELEPRSRDVQLTRAGAALATGAYGIAAVALEAAWRLQPEEGPALLHDAVVARLLADDASGAATLADEFLDIAGQPNVEQLRTVLTAAVYAAMPALARRAAERCITIHADDPEAWILVSQARQSVDDLTGAAAALEAADWLRPLSPADRSRLGDLLFAAGVPAMAAAQYAEVFGTAPDGDQAERLASAWMAAHRYDDAALVLQAITSTSPNARLWALLGDVRLEQERYAQAAAAYRSSLALSSDDDIQARLRHCEIMAE